MSLTVDTAKHDTAAAAPHAQEGKRVETRAHGQAEQAQDTASNENSTIDKSLAKREAAKRKTLGDAWGDVKESAGNFFLNIRQRAIRATPRLIVNNSSNILGAAHVATEVMMFKASLPADEALVSNPTGPIDYVKRAISRVYTESFSGSKSDIADIKKAIKGRPLSGFIEHIRDVDGATDRVVASKVGTINKKGETITRANLSLSNPWQTRSTLAGLIVWTLSALIPDKKESPEEVERMSVMRETSPISYVGERIRQALWVPDWGTHKRQMIGLGVMMSGVFSLLGSWRNNIVKPGVGKVYDFNAAYFCTSALTFLSSLPLLFGSDDQKGFGGFGAIMTGRLAFLPGSILRKFKGDKTQAAYYTASMGAFQLENWTQALIGGAEKDRNDAITDHTEVKWRAHEEAKQIKAERKHARTHGEHGSVAADADSASPRPLLSSVASAELAMPERRAAMEEAQVAAAGA